jgi:stress-induced morphogen
MELGEVVVAADQAVVEEDFGHRSAAVGALEHDLDLVRLCGQIDLGKAGPERGQQVFGHLAVGAGLFGVNFDFRHGSGCGTMVERTHFVSHKSVQMTIQREELEILIEDGFGGAKCKASDLTGTEDHWGLEICWEGFAGLNLLEQHRKVLDLLRPHMDGGSGIIHAVQIKTSTPS